MKPSISLFGFVLLFGLFISGQARAYGVADELKNLIGYTVVSSDYVQKILTSNYTEKYIVLQGGGTFKVEGMFLDPLVLSEVIIFSQRMSEEMVLKYKGKLPEYMFYSYKLLVGDKIYDATPE